MRPNDESGHVVVSIWKCGQPEYYRSYCTFAEMSNQEKSSISLFVHALTYVESINVLCKTCSFDEISYSSNVQFFKLICNCKCRSHWDRSRVSSKLICKCRSHWDRSRVSNAKKDFMETEPKILGQHITQNICKKTNTRKSHDAGWKS